MDFNWSKALDERFSRKPRSNGGKLLKLNGAASLPTIKIGSPTAVGADSSHNGSRPQSQASRQQRVTAFLERQNLKARGYDEASHALCDLQRKLNEASKSGDDVVFRGAKGIPGFREYLIRQFGSIVAGWRALDYDKRGRLTFYEFCNACRRMGYHGNLKVLWSQLDSKRNGAISLWDIDPEAGHYIGTFKLVLLKTYGNMLKAWQEGIDVNGNGRIEAKEIGDACERLGLNLDANKLFSMLKCGHGGLGMTLMDFNPDAYNRYVLGDVHGLNQTRGDTEFLEDVPAVNLTRQNKSMELVNAELDRKGIEGGRDQWRKQLIAKDKQELEAEQRNTVEFRVGLHTVPGFKKALIIRCGSLYQAWREAFDLDGTGHVTFGEFTQALSRLAFHGNIKALWKDLDTDCKGYLVFADLDPEMAALLKDLRKKLVSKYGNMLLAWLKALDTRGTGVAYEPQFIQCCAQVGIQEDAALRLFGVLQPDDHLKYITVQNFDTKAYLALRSGDLRMISEPDEEAAFGGRKPSEMSFEERQYCGFNYQLQRAWMVARRDDFAQASFNANTPERLIDTPEEFEAVCFRKFGTMMGAWRHWLDSDGNGKLTFNEFCPQVRRMGYQGDLNVLWHRYAESRPYICIKDLDPEADELVTSFLALLTERYGTLEAAWRQGFRQDPHGSIDGQAMQEACERMGYTSDIPKLFRCLQPANGKQLITIWDLDPACTRQRQRGEEVMPPPSPLAHKSSARAQQSALPAVMSADGDIGVVAETPNIPTMRSSTVSGSQFIVSELSLLEQLRKSLRHKYGSTLAAWRGALDVQSKGSTSFSKFCLSLDECSFHGNRKTIWRELVESAGGASVTYKAVDADTARLIDKFRGHLLANFLSLQEAWRKGLDLPSLGLGGRLAEEDFKAACERVGFTLSARGLARLFQAMLARPGQRALTVQDLRESLLATLLAPEREAAWSGAPPEEAFQDPEPEAVEARADGRQDVRRSFQSKEPSQEEQSAATMLAGQISGEAEANEEEAEGRRGSQNGGGQAREKSRGPAARPDAVGAEAEEADPSSWSLKAPRSRPWSPKSPRSQRPWSPRSSSSSFRLASSKRYALSGAAADISRAHQDHHEHHMAMTSLAQFKAMMEKKFGSLFSAWRNFLDADRNGVVTQRDFASACRELGVKAVMQVWSELDADANGQISMKEFDPELSAAFRAFEAKLMECHGSTWIGWKKAFDPENTLRCDEDKFLAGTTRLGLELPEDEQGTPMAPARLFRLLRPEPGRPFLMYKDVWTPPPPSDAGAGHASPKSGSRPAVDSP